MTVLVENILYSNNMENAIVLGADNRTMQRHLFLCDLSYPIETEPGIIRRLADPATANSFTGFMPRPAGLLIDTEACQIIQELQYNIY
jgi:hypothetical protein